MEESDGGGNVGYVKFALDIFVRVVLVSARSKYCEATLEGEEDLLPGLFERDGDEFRNCECASWEFAVGFVVAALGVGVLRRIG